MTRNKKSEVEALLQAVEGLHECRAKYKEKTHVTEKFEGETVWDGDVYVFELISHPTAQLAYAWSSPVAGSERRRFFAVQHAGPVKSAQDAVRASIAKDYGG